MQTEKCLWAVDALQGPWAFHLGQDKNSKKKKNRAWGLIASGSLSP